MTERSLAQEFQFSGKLIIICNTFPKSADAEAVRSRGFELRIEPNVIETSEFLRAAVKNKEKFPDQKVAQTVLAHLLEKLNEETLSKISYRTLQRDYEFAVHNPDSLHESRGNAAGRPNSKLKSPKKLIVELSKTKMKVKDQLLEFEKLTGFKRRTFFKYRKQLALGAD